MPEADKATREAVRACSRGLPPSPAGGEVAFGFDGMVDTIRELVDGRSSPTEYTRIETLAEFGERIVRSAEQRNSVAIEWTRLETRGGGHACHLPRAFGRLGYDPVGVGTYGDPIADPFREELADCELVSVGEPGYVEAVEFDDGKALISDLGDYARLDWEELCRRIDVEELAGRVDGTALLGMGYWAVIPGFPSILEGVHEEVWPTLADPPELVVLDPSDVRQLEESELADGAEAIRTLAGSAPVVFTANRLETMTLHDALVADPSGESSARRAADLRDRLGVDRYVVHGADAASCAGPDGTATVRLPRTDDPALTTSAGDHFAVGLGVGLLEGLPDDAALVLANAVAGWFVRNGRSPGYGDVVGFVESYLDRF